MQNASMAVTGLKAGKKLSSVQKVTVLMIEEKRRKSAQKLRVHPVRLPQHFHHHAVMANAMMNQGKTAILFLVINIPGARNR